MDKIPFSALNIHTADRKCLEKSIRARLEEEDSIVTGDNDINPTSDENNIVDYGKDLSKCLQNVNIFISLRAKYKNTANDSIFEFHQAYLRFENRIFLDLFTMEFCTYAEIVDKFNKDFSILYTDSSATWDGTIFSEINPTVSEYFRIRENMANSAMFDRGVLNIWRRKYFNEIIDEPRFYLDCD